MVRFLADKSGRPLPNLDMQIMWSFTKDNSLDSFLYSFVFDDPGSTAAYA